MSPAPPRLGEVRDALDEAAFGVYAAEVTARYGTLTSALLLFCTLAWWPLDAIVKPDERYVAAFTALRIRAALVEATALALFLKSSWVRRHARVTAPLLYLLLVAAFGYSLGALGGPDLTWLADATLAVIPVALLPMRLPTRVLVTVAVAAVLMASFFLPFPANLSAVTAHAQAAYIVFAVLASIAGGVVSTDLTRRAFFQQRELDRSNAALASLTDDLSARVAAQTQELRSLAIHLERVQEAERRRIARDLHDDLGQRLTAMRLTLARVERRVGDRDDDLPELVSDLSALVDGASGAARDFVSELRPRVLDDYGLAAAVEWLCERVRTHDEPRCTLTIAAGFPDGTALPDPETALCLFRVVQEATTNALKHAKARTLEVSLAAVDHRFRVSVRDDGVGFDPSHGAAGFGLLGLRERVRAAGGQLTIDSHPGQGTCVTAEVLSRHIETEEPT